MGTRLQAESARGVGADEDRVDPDRELASRRDGVPRVVLGAPGGTQIAMGVLQVLLNVMDFDMSMVEAVSSPRFSSTSDAIDIMNRIPGYVVEPLEADGYEVIRSALPGEMFTVYMHYKRDEWERFMATVTEWDVETYIDCLP